MSANTCRELSNFTIVEKPGRSGDYEIKFGSGQTGSKTVDGSFFQQYIWNLISGTLEGTAKVKYDALKEDTQTAFGRMSVGEKIVFPIIGDYIYNSSDRRDEKDSYTIWQSIPIGQFELYIPKKSIAAPYAGGKERFIALEGAEKHENIYRRGSREIPNEVKSIVSVAQAASARKISEYWGSLDLQGVKGESDSSSITLLAEYCILMIIVSMEKKMKNIYLVHFARKILELLQTLSESGQCENIETNCPSWIEIPGKYEVVDPKTKKTTWVEIPGKRGIFNQILSTCPFCGETGINRGNANPVENHMYEKHSDLICCPPVRDDPPRPSSNSAHFPPISRESIVYPSIWRKDAGEHVKNWLVALQYQKSIEYSYDRLFKILQEYYVVTQYNGMKEFAENTDIISGITPLTKYVSKPPITPYEFQRKDMNDILQFMTKCKRDRLGKSDDTLVISYEMAEKYFFPEFEMEEDEAEEAEAAHDEDDQETVWIRDPLHASSAKGTVHMIFKTDGSHISGMEFSIFRDRYRSILAQCQIKSAACGIYYFKHPLRYMKMHIGNFTVMPVAEGSVTDFNKINDGLYRASRGLINLEEIMFVSACEAAGGQIETVQYALQNASIRRRIAANFFDRIAAAEGANPMTSEFAEATSGLHPKVRKASAFYEKFTRNKKNATEISGMAVECTAHRGVPGGGKTAIAALCALVINKAKALFGDQIDKHIELVFVCDQPLIRHELFLVCKMLGVNVCEITDPVKITMEVHPEEEVRRDGSRPPPSIDNPKRDILICNAEFAVAYRAGHASDAMTGNPDAIIFFDEFGNRCGNYAGLEEFENCSASDKKSIAVIISTHASAPLTLVNCPGSLKVCGASMVSDFTLEESFKRIRGNADSRKFKTTSDQAGSIYIGSQFFTPDDQKIGLWNVCPASQFENLLERTSNPIVMRTLNHQSALELRKLIFDAIELFRTGNPEYRDFERLIEMENYLNYDIGTYTGDNIAKYTFGLLFFINAYATAYVGPSDAETTCEKMVEKYFSYDGYANVQMTELVNGKETETEFAKNVRAQKNKFVSNAPWPKSKFIFINEQFRMFPRVAPTQFLEHFGISNSYMQKPAQTKILERAVIEYKRVLKENEVLVAIDPKPIKFGLEMVASMKKISIEELKIEIESVMLRAKTQHSQLNEQVAASLEALGKQNLSNTNAAKKPSSQGQARQGGTQKVQVVAPHILAQQQDSVNDEASKSRSKNPVTGFDYYCLNANQMNVFRNVQWQYLFSYGIVCLEEDNDAAVKEAYSMMKTASPHRTIMMISTQIGAYGINIEGATTAIATSRATLDYSAATLLQFFCRVGRRGMSNEARIFAHVLTIYKIVDHALVSETGQDLLPFVVCTVIRNLHKNPAVFQQTCQMLENAGADEYAQFLIDGVMALGVPADQASRLPFLVGSIFDILDESDPFGREFSNEGVHGRLDQILFVCERFASTYDSVNFGNYANILAIRDERTCYGEDVIAIISKRAHDVIAESRMKKTGRQLLDASIQKDDARKSEIDSAKGKEQEKLMQAYAALAKRR